MLIALFLPIKLILAVRTTYFPKFVLNIKKSERLTNPSPVRSPWLSVIPLLPKFERIMKKSVRLTDPSLLTSPGLGLGDGDGGVGVGEGGVGVGLGGVGVTGVGVMPLIYGGSVGSVATVGSLFGSGSFG